MKQHSLEDASLALGIDCKFVLRCIEVRWLSPFVVNPPSTVDPALDEEDFARLRLIVELQRDFGVNDEAVPIILHLIDQLYFVQSALKQRQAGSGQHAA